MTVTVWFDPSCPFTWRTSRWVKDVAGRRGEKVSWRFLSLAILNEGKEIPENYRQAHLRARAALRVLTATDGHHGQDAVDRLYAAIGKRVHDDDERLTREVLVAALAEAELPASLIEAAEDAEFDRIVRASHDEGQARVGTETGSPVIAIDDGPGFFGPVVSSVPGPEAADQLFDAMRLLSGVREFSEVKRAREPLS
ncbi:DsbA family protein [Actinokineospora xionganensis]|uniref:Disulfide bond formation protein DsbA n=1 Tax=Actinokineospora xionganensis TaxID=2684470 RepID=A0ABR7LEL9_9PSEU|nr:DsbA family protein [Actinokineospora xionganensis]MBC6451067.1 disulfide bond formation protein DsbA [Actinokineospora xionganensis]